LYNIANEMFNGKLKMINQNYNEHSGKVEIDMPQIIKPQAFDTKNFSLSEFNDMIDYFSKEQIQMFAKDSRPEIKKNAKLKLKTL
jgi:hypothetical protein